MSKRWTEIWQWTLPAAIITGLPLPAIAHSGAGLDPTAVEMPFAEETVTEREAQVAQLPYNPALDRMDSYNDLGELEATPMQQVTTVEQLRDISPGDWAFEALRSLVERYGCIEGYPDQTYRGNRALTRYEFAAGLNSCLNAVESLIASSGGGIAPEDLEQLQRLAQEFEAELATIGGRIDNLEGRVAFLEDNQFSTTTKLIGQAFFNLTGAFSDGDILAEGRDAFRAERTASEPVTRVVDDDPEIVLSDLVWLNLNTSFTGRDNLTIQLASGNSNSPANQFVSAGLFNTYGVPFLDQSAGGGDNNTLIRELFYSFAATDSLQVVVGPRINWYRYFDNNRFTFILNGAGSFNSSGSTLLNMIDRGSGAAAIWDISEQFRFGAAYLGENTEFLAFTPGFNTASDPEEGLFDGTNSITAEVTFSPSDRINLRFLYNRARREAIDGQIGGAAGEPIGGFVDAGPEGGELDDLAADVFSVNFDWLITERIGVFGRYGYSISNLDIEGRESEEVEVQSLQLGVAFPDLFKEGAIATVSYLIPYSIRDGREFFVSGGGDGGVQYELEGAYFFPLTDNIGLYPAFYFIANPNNFDDNANIFVGHVRTQFTF
ncbi:MAG: iron uptake porin [Cyanophyceae cyanobacterium]